MTKSQHDCIQYSHNYRIFTSTYENRDYTANLLLIIAIVFTTKFTLFAQMDVVAACRVVLLLPVTTQVYYNTFSTLFFVVWNLPLKDTRNLTEALRLKLYLVRIIWTLERLNSQDIAKYGLSSC